MNDPVEINLKLFDEMKDHWTGTLTSVSAPFPLWLWLRLHHCLHLYSICFAYFCCCFSSCFCYCTKVYTLVNANMKICLTHGLEFSIFFLASLSFSNTLGLFAWLQLPLKCFLSLLAHMQQSPTAKTKKE